MITYFRIPLDSSKRILVPTVYRTIFVSTLLVLTYATCISAEATPHTDTASTLVYRIIDHLIANDDTIRSNKRTLTLSAFRDVDTVRERMASEAPTKVVDRFVFDEEIESSRTPMLFYQHSIRFCSAGDLADTSLCPELLQFESSAPLPLPLPWIPLTGISLSSDTLFVSGHSKVLLREGYDGLDSSAWSGWIVCREAGTTADASIEAQVYLSIRSHVRHVSVVGNFRYYHEADDVHSCRYRHNGLLLEGEVDALLTGFVQVEVSGMDAMRFPSIRHISSRVSKNDHK